MSFQHIKQLYSRKTYGFFIAAFYIFKHDLPKEITKISIIASILFDVTATIKCEPIQLKMIAFDFGLSRLQVQTL